MNVPPNEQPIEKLVKTPSPTMETKLDIVDIFSTIQGEGPFTGRRAIFVRLAGCNLQCPSCDTDYTSKRKYVKTKYILKDIFDMSNTGQLVVITGGEPFRQNITILCNALSLAGHPVQIETNGTLPPSIELSKAVTVVCSPKAGRINKSLARRADCFKYVMSSDSVDPEDGLPVLALNHTATPRVARPPIGNIKPIYLQPMDSQHTVQNMMNIDAVKESCMEHGYILQLQIHKIIRVE